MKNFLLSLLSQKENSSSIRALMLIWNIGIFIIWSMISVYKQELQIIPESVVTIIVLITFGKVTQKIFGEK